MNDIFTDGKIYPHEGKIKDHFKDFYDAVFIAFLPFFQVERKPADTNNLKMSQQLSYEQAKEELDVLKDIPSFEAEFFLYSNKDYPSDEEIYTKGTAISWKSILEGSGLKNYAELNKALATSIGALRQVFRRPELTEKLDRYTREHNIWYPTEGGFDIFSKVAIYKALRLLEKNQIVITDEFYEKTTELVLDKLTDFEFSQKIGYKDYYIYSADKEILFTIEWDSFFFLIATDQEKIYKILSENLFEGFLCDQKTKHSWDYEEGEIEKYLSIEEKQESNKNKKPWWKLWS